MAIFDQRGQQVGQQSNVAGDVSGGINFGGEVNFDAVQNWGDVARELEKLKDEIGKAAEAEAIDAEVATDAEYQVTKAVQQAKKPEPDKKTVLDHLEAAKTLVAQVAAAGGILTGLIQAIATVQKFF